MLFGVTKDALKKQRWDAGKRLQAGEGWAQPWRLAHLANGIDHSRNEAWPTVTVAKEGSSESGMLTNSAAVAGTAAAAQTYLPSTPSGMKYYQTLHKSVMSLGQEWDCLSREARATEALYTATGLEGQRMSVLMQPAQASGIAALPVPQIQPQELRLKNARMHSEIRQWRRT